MKIFFNSKKICRCREMDYFKCSLYSDIKIKKFYAEKSRQRRTKLTTSWTKTSYSVKYNRDGAAEFTWALRFRENCRASVNDNNGSSIVPFINRVTKRLSPILCGLQCSCTITLHSALTLGYHDLCVVGLLLL